jgi:hypothetical protein
MKSLLRRLKNSVVVMLSAAALVVAGGVRALAVCPEYMILNPVNAPKLYCHLTSSSGNTCNYNCQTMSTAPFQYTT